MQPSARIILNVDGKDKSYFLWNGTEVYFQKLRHAYLDIINDKYSDYLYFGFFTLCAATLEYSLNFILTDFCLTKFGLDDYKLQAQNYIRLRFSEKLRQAPEILSNGECEMIETNVSYTSHTGAGLLTCCHLLLSYVLLKADEKRKGEGLV